MRNFDQKPCGAAPRFFSLLFLSFLHSSFVLLLEHCYGYREDDKAKVHAKWAEPRVYRAPLAKNGIMEMLIPQLTDLPLIHAPLSGTFQNVRPLRRLDLIQPGALTLDAVWSFMPHMGTSLQKGSRRCKQLDLSTWKRLGSKRSQIPWGRASDEPGWLSRYNSTDPRTHCG